MTSRVLMSALALGAIVAAAGCGGGSTTPKAKATASPTASPTSSPTGSPSSGPAATWTFGGSSDAITPVTGTTPAAISLTAYQGITVSNIQFVAPTSGGGSLLTVTDAVNGADGVSTPDVSPTTLPVDNASAASPVIYISLYYNSSSPLIFGTQTPSVTVSGSILGADTTCELDVYSNGSGTSYAWMSTGAIGTVSGTSVTIAPATISGSALKLSAGQDIVAVACN